MMELIIVLVRLNNISEWKNDLALAIGFALSFSLCYNVWTNDLYNISELKNERTNQTTIRAGIR